MKKIYIPLQTSHHASNMHFHISQVVLTQSRDVGLVRVHDHLGIGTDLANAQVDARGGEFWLRVALDHLGVAVHHHQVAGGHLQCHARLRQGVLSVLLLLLFMLWRRG